MYLCCISIYIFLKENRHILRTHDDTVTLPWTEQNRARTKHGTPHTAGRLLASMPRSALRVHVHAGGRASRAWLGHARDLVFAGFGVSGATCSVWPGFREMGGSQGRGECSPRLSKGRGASAVAACRSKLCTARAARRSLPAPRKKEWRWGRWLGVKGLRTLLLSLSEGEHTDNK